MRVLPRSFAAAVALTAAVAASPLLGAGVAHASGFTSLITDSFQGATVSDPWNIISGPNSVCLTGSSNTSGTPIPGCSSTATTPGSLQLTNNSNTQVGAILYGSNLDTSKGLDISWNSYQYNGTGADGINFIMAAVDPSTGTPPSTVGPSGGSLGYAATVNAAGLPYGYLGFGADVYGNYENAGFGTGGTSQSPETIAVRGPGNGVLSSTSSAPNYPLLSSLALPPGYTLDNSTSTTPVPVAEEVVINTTSSPVTAQDSRVTVPAGDYLFAVQPLQNGVAQSNWSYVTGALPNASGFVGNSSWLGSNGIPLKLAFGFAGSTGGSTEYHQISTLSANTLVPASAPSAPSIQSVSGTSTGVSVTVTPPTNDGGATISGYQAQVSTDGGSTFTPVPSSNVTTNGNTVDIGGLTTGTSYVVEVAATNAAGTGPYSTVSSPQIAGTAPTIASASFTGTPAVGQTLTAVSSGVTGTPTPTETYQWFDGTSPILGAVGQTYVIQPSDYNQHISVVITERNTLGGASATSSSSVVAGTAPTIASASFTGTPAVGQTLTAVSSGVTGYPTPTETYQWLDGNVPIPGGNGQTYVVQPSDYGQSMRVAITETNSLGSANASSNSSTVTGSRPTITSASITGSPTVGQTLTAVSNGATGYPAPVESYQWYSGTLPISGATGQTYVVQPSDYNQLINVVITESNSAGSASATSGFVIIGGTAPTIASASFTGTPAVGQTLTAVSSGVTGYPTPTETYQWFDGSSMILGANRQTYVVQPSDYNQPISVLITENNPYGVATAMSSPSTVAGVAPTIASASFTGTPAVGQTLTAVSSGVTGTPTPTETYQWFDGALPISGATSSTYTLTNADYGQLVSVVITETNSSGSASATASPLPVAGTAPTIASSAITGTPAVGQTITAVSGGVTGYPAPVESYQWFDGTTPIPGATGRTYVVQPSDYNQLISVDITETNTAGAVTLPSGSPVVLGGVPVIAGLSITGNNAVGQTLTAVPSGVSGYPAPTLTYQWYRDCPLVAGMKRAALATTCVAVTGATSSTYTVTSADYGLGLRVIVTATNVAGSVAAGKSTTAVTGLAPSIASVTISGTPAVGQTLSATANGVTGYPAPTLTYQWYRNGTAIAGATGQTYVLANSDLGGDMTVKITATNAAGTASAQSAHSSPVLGLAPTVSGVTISGTPTVGQTLSALVGNEFAGLPASVATYQWYDGKSAITGATGQTYVVAPSDFGQAISVTVSIANAYGSDSASSPALATVTGATPSVGAPQSVIAEVSPTGRGFVTWSPSKVTGGATVTGYQVLFAPQGSTTWTALPASDVVGNAAHLSGLTPGVAYSFEVVPMSNLSSAPSAKAASSPSPQLPGRPFQAYRANFSATSAQRAEIADLLNEIAATQTSGVQRITLTGYAIYEPHSAHSRSHYLTRSEASHLATERALSAEKYMKAEAAHLGISLAHVSFSITSVVHSGKAGLKNFELFRRVSVSL